MTKVENQWCEIGEHVCEKTDPCSFDDAGAEFTLIQVCPSCRHAFVSTKIYWGSQPYQYFWRLINPIKVAEQSVGPVKMFTVELTKKDVVRLRAAGFDLMREDKYVLDNQDS